MNVEGVLLLRCNYLGLMIVVLKMPHLLTGKLIPRQGKALTGRYVIRVRYEVVTLHAHGCR